MQPIKSLKDSENLEKYVSISLQESGWKTRLPNNTSFGEREDHYLVVAEAVYPFVFVCFGLSGFYCAASSEHTVDGRLCMKPAGLSVQMSDRKANVFRLMFQGGGGNKSIISRFPAHM